MPNYSYANFTDMPLNVKFSDVESDVNVVDRMFAVWYDHKGLTEWVYDLYVSKGGSNEISNFKVFLTNDDIEKLKDAVLSTYLPNENTAAAYATANSYWQSVDNAFIVNAQQHLSNGYNIYFYTK
jgi:hypothetical protein